MNPGNVVPTGALPPGRELDALVAEKVMGWPPAAGDFPPIPSFTNYPGSSCVRVIISHISAGDCISRDFSPSTDFAAAWQVVEKLTSDGLRFKLESEPKDVDLNYHGEDWSAAFYREATEGFGSHEFEDRSRLAPHAICLAALKAVGALL